MNVEKPLLQKGVGDGNYLSKMDSQGNIQQVLALSRIDFKIIDNNTSIG